MKLYNRRDVTVFGPPLLMGCGAVFIVGGSLAVGIGIGPGWGLATLFGSALLVKALT